MYSNLGGIKRSPDPRREEQLFSTVALLQRGGSSLIVAVAKDMLSKFKFNFLVLRKFDIETFAVRAFV